MLEDILRRFDLLFLRDNYIEERSVSLFNFALFLQGNFGFQIVELLSQLFGIEGLLQELLVVNYIFEVHHAGGNWFANDPGRLVYEVRSEADDLVLF